MLFSSATFAAPSPDLRAGATVLVVDDTEAQRYAVARVLKSQGFDVVEASTGAEALAAARAGSIDAIVLDVNLPDYDGFELCRQLKAQHTGLLPVLHLSSVDVSGAARARGLDAGADGYLTHPFDANELRAAVTALVRLKRGEVERNAQAATTALLLEALDALPDHIALLGPTGDVIAVNRSWTDFGIATGAQFAAAAGVNHCAVCDAAGRMDTEDARAAARGIRQVIAGEREEFSLEHPCHSPASEHWYRMSARAVHRPGPVAVIVTHSDRTAERLAARKEAEARGRADAAHQARIANEAFAHSLSEHSQELVSILDAEGICRYISSSVQRILGYAVEDVRHRTHEDFVHRDDLPSFAAQFAALLAEGHGASRRVSTRARHAAGGWRHLEGIAQNLLHEPSVQGVAINLHDVTERVEAEQARSASEARFGHFLETTPEGVLAMDPAGVITYANPRIEVLLALPKGALLGRSLLEFLPAEESEAAEDLFAIPAPTAARTEELRLRSHDGTLLHVQAAINPLLDAAGAYTGTLAMISDVSERVRTARVVTDALRAADLDRRRLEAILEAMPAGVFIMNVDGATTHINPAARQNWGGSVPLTKFSDYSAYRAWWPDTGQRLAPHEFTIARAIESRAPVPPQLMEIERFDGTLAYLLNSAAPIFDSAGELTGGVVISVDVTARQADAREREQLLASLENERRHLAAIFEHAPSFMAVMRGADHVYERINPAYQALIGARDVLGRPIAEAVPETTESGTTPRLDAVRATGVPFVARQGKAFLTRTPGGPVETRYIDVVHQRLDEPDGNHAILTHGVDVTEQVVATERLLATSLRLRDQFAKLPVPTYLWELQDEQFVLVECNEAALVHLPRSSEDAIGRPMHEIFPEMIGVVPDLHRSLRDGVVIRRSLQVDLGGDRGRRSVDLTMGPQPPDRVLVHAIDTTERTELEAQLRQAQKMDAVGRLAGGVAHDFNNLLTVIGAHSAFLLESLDSSDPQHEDAEAIQKASVRAAGLTRQLLAFSRKQILKPVITDLNATVEDTRKMLVRLLGEDIEIVLSLEEGLPRVVADPSQLDQVIVNLAVNARDAMPSGGRLSISTTLLSIAEVEGRGGLFPAGAYVSLLVADTGAGMSAAVQSRLFEPFFTTKEPGKGTGLGLATVYGIVKQSAGYIMVESAPGAGSAFQVLLPAVTAGEGAVQLQDAERAAARGMETILLVEDEDAVRDVARRVLRRHGYVVLEASHGDAALAISRDFPTTIHLVVTDAVMPGMGGAEVVRRLQAERPSLRALFMSGYTDDEMVRRGIASSEVPLVQKPFTPSALAGAVRTALDLGPRPAT